MITWGSMHVLHCYLEPLFGDFLGCVLGLKEQPFVARLWRRTRTLGFGSVLAKLFDMSHGQNSLSGDHIGVIQDPYSRATGPCIQSFDHCSYHCRTLDADPKRHRNRNPQPLAEETPQTQRTGTLCL